MTTDSTEQFVGHLQLAKQNGVSETEPRPMSATTMAKRVFAEDRERDEA